MERLIVIENGEENIVDLSSRVVTIGRSSKNDISIKDRNASRRHCNIIKVGTSSWFAVDCESQNGTYVNGELIKKVELQDGDKVTVGNAEMIFVTEGKTTPPSFKNEDNESAEKKEQDSFEIEASVEISQTESPEEISQEAECDPKITSGEKNIDAKAAFDLLGSMVQEGDEKEQTNIQRKKYEEDDMGDDKKTPISVVLQGDDSLAKEAIPESLSEVVPVLKENCESFLAKENHNESSGEESQKENAKEFLVSTFESFLKEFSKQVVANQKNAELLFISLLSSNHCLLRGQTGSGKYTIARTLSALLSLPMKRFSLMDKGDELLKSLEGMEFPVSTPLLLIDHLQEAPRERQVYLLSLLQKAFSWRRKRTYSPDPFMVLASHCSEVVDSSCSHSYKDFFLFEILVESLSLEEELEVIERFFSPPTKETGSLLNIQSFLVSFQKIVDEVIISPEILEKAVSLIYLSRPGRENSYINQYVAWGASRRTSILFIQALKARAALYLRTEVTREDLEALFLPLMRHRLSLTSKAVDEGIRVEDICQYILNA